MAEARDVFSIGLVYDTHPVEPTSSGVAALVAADPIDGVQPIQANVRAAECSPVQRFVDEELTSAFRKDGTYADTYEGQRAKELAEIYRAMTCVIDVHNNLSTPEKYVQVGRESSAITLQIARFLMYGMSF
jgi:hypothetical protein